MARVYREFEGDVTPPAVQQQDDPAGPYIVIDVDPAFADPSVARATGIALVDGDGVESEVFHASAMTALDFSGGSAVPTIPATLAQNAALAAVVDSDGGFRPAMNNGSKGPLLANAEVTALTLVIPPNLGACGSLAGVPAPGTPVYLAGVPIVTKTGNSLLCFVAFDPAGGVSVLSVKLGDSLTFTEVETTLDCGAYKLGIYILKNQTATNLGVALPLIGVTFDGGDPLKFIVAALEIKDCAVDPSDVAVNSAATDEYPSTAASADTAAANEVVLAALMVSGAALSSDPIVDSANLIPVTGAFGLSSGAFSLYVWRTNLIAISNPGFAATLPESRAWAAGLYSFQ